MISDAGDLEGIEASLCIVGTSASCGEGAGMLRVWRDAVVMSVSRLFRKRNDLRVR